MALEAGEPIAIGGGWYKVGVSDVGSDGGLAATGAITVSVPDADFLDPAEFRAQARGLALDQVRGNPDLLTPVRRTGGPPRTGPNHQEIGDKTPWSDGNSKHLDERGSNAKAKRLLSPDSSDVDL